MIILVCLALFGIGGVCDRSLEPLTIINRYPYEIHAHTSCQDSLVSKRFEIFYDTIDHNGVDKIFEPESSIHANSTRSIFAPSWRNMIKYQCPNQRMHLFIIARDTIGVYSWDEIVARQLYIESFEFTIAELDLLKWTVVIGP